MKIYIGDKDINDESYKKITEIQILNFVAEDSECTSIVLDNILRKFQLNELITKWRLRNQFLVQWRISGQRCVQMCHLIVVELHVEASKGVKD